MNAVGELCRPLTKAPEALCLPEAFIKTAAVISGTSDGLKTLPEVFTH